MTLISLLQTDSPPDAQQFVDKISEELDWCHSHMDKLHGQTAASNTFFGYVWSVLSVEKVLASWGAQMADNCAVLSRQLQLLLYSTAETKLVLEIDIHQQLQHIVSQIQYIGSEVEQIRSEVRETIQHMDLHHISLAMFSVKDTLGRPIPISLTHCGNFEALDRMLKACIFNRLEAGACYVEQGDYNLFLPEGIVRCADFAQTMKLGMELDMSIIKQPRFRYKCQVNLSSGHSSSS
ncbi:hypothetical protein K438DRAFT_2132597 [Mycena galopus ATCC 62051]|nr:hypothetical protein K438DRAFT_2132597 [Mycena galopus ATCC 62051]